jgi:hypothetical protein
MDHVSGFRAQPEHPGVFARQCGHGIMPAIVTRRIARVWAAKARVSSHHRDKGRRTRYVFLRNAVQSHYGVMSDPVDEDRL